MTDKEHLYNLLPAIYRLRDAKEGEPLHALLSLIEDEFQSIERDIEGLYNNWFIETCDEWVVLYIADLLGVRNLHTIASSNFSQRAYVANTLAYRRRKGTSAVVEQLARDVTGWPSHVVEFFQLLATTQNLNHVRPDNVTLDLRSANSLELLGGPFERAAYTLDVRHIDRNRGKYNIPNIGLFLWRLQSYPITRSTARAVGSTTDRRYMFSSLGNDIPLFNNPQTEEEITQLAEEINVPGMLRRRALYDDLENYRRVLSAGGTPDTRYFGAKPVLAIFKDGQDKPMEPEFLQICNLSNWDAPGWVPPRAKEFKLPDGSTEKTKVAVDPALGRLVFLTVSQPTQVEVSYSYGFGGDVGGGPYERRQTFAEPTQAIWKKIVSKQDLNADFNSLSSALTDWADPNKGNKANAIITITDNSTYAESIKIELSDSRFLVIQANNGNRPMLRIVDTMGNVTTLKVTGGNGIYASLILNGLLIEGGIHIAENSLGNLQVIHCTLVPGWSLSKNGQPQQPRKPSINVEKRNDRLELEIDHSIVGSLCLPAEIASLIVKDSIIDSPIREPRAKQVPALVSGNLVPFPPSLGSASPSVNVKIGNEGPYRTILSTVPTTLAEARDRLQEAIRTAYTSPAFTKASVIMAGDRLVILPGTAGIVTIEAAENDPTASELRLDSTSARQVHALVSGNLPPSLTLSSSPAEMNIRVGAGAPYKATINFTSMPVALVQMRAQLQIAIRAAHTSSGFTDALVALLENRLIVLPGRGGDIMIFSSTSTDRTTLIELALDSEKLAIAAIKGGNEAGPPTTLERTTVYGAVHVRELTLASDVIFTDPVIIERQQKGCVRFSFVPDSSQTPRRYHCQPDLEIAKQIEDAEKKAKASNTSLDKSQRDLIKAKILEWLVPAFTSTRYGNPSYAQLSIACPKQIQTGGEDGSEMGVFHHLQQPKREANLLAALDEYLRFGLEAGIFYVT